MSWSELLCISPLLVCVGALYVATIFHKSTLPSKAPPGYHFEWGVGLVPNCPSTYPYVLKKRRPRRKKR